MPLSRANILSENFAFCNNNSHTMVFSGISSGGHRLEDVIDVEDMPALEVTFP